MNLLDAPTLALIRQDLTNHARTVDMHKSGMHRPADELCRGYASAVETIGRLLQHIDMVDNNTVADVVCGGLSYVYSRTKWGDNPHDKAAFDAMSGAYEALKASVDAYNLAVMTEGVK